MVFRLVAMTTSTPGCHRGVGADTRCVAAAPSWGRPAPYARCRGPRRLFLPVGHPPRRVSGQERETMRRLAGSHPADTLPAETRVCAQRRARVYPWFAICCALTLASRCGYCPAALAPLARTTVRSSRATVPRCLPWCLPWCRVANRLARSAFPALHAARWRGAGSRYRGPPTTASSRAPTWSRGVFHSGANVVSRRLQGRRRAGGRPGGWPPRVREARARFDRPRAATTGMVIRLVVLLGHSERC